MIYWLHRLLIVLVCFVLTACSSTQNNSAAFIKKRRYNKGWHIDFVQKNTKGTKEVLASLEKVLADNDSVVSVKVKGGELADSLADSRQAINELAPAVEDSLPETTNLEHLCDTIVFKDGQKMEAKVLEVSKKKVKYKFCNNPKGATFTHDTRKVKELWFKTGSKVRMKDLYPEEENRKEKSSEREEESNVENSSEKKTEIMSILSFSFLILSLLWPLTIFTIPASLILGILGLMRILKNKDKFIGKWLSITGIVGSSIALILLVLFYLLLFLLWGSGGYY